MRNEKKNSLKDKCSIGWSTRKQSVRVPKWYNFSSDFENKCSYSGRVDILENSEHRKQPLYTEKCAGTSLWDLMILHNRQRKWILTLHLTVKSSNPPPPTPQIDFIAHTAPETLTSPIWTKWQYICNWASLDTYVCW
jgi:hypothetical protein